MALADLERAALDDAYADAVREAFDRLVDNIVADSPVADPAAQFARAVEAARDARVIAQAKLGITAKNERNPP